MLGLSCLAAGKAAAQLPFKPLRSVWPMKISIVQESGLVEEAGLMQRNTARVGKRVGLLYLWPDGIFAAYHHHLLLR